MALVIHFKGISFPLPGKTAPAQRQSAEQSVTHPSDGFQPSGAASQPRVAKPTASAGVTLQVTAQELASANFQQSLQALSSAGVPVSIALLNAAQTPPQEAAPTDAARTEGHPSGGHPSTPSRPLVGRPRP